LDEPGCTCADYQAGNPTVSDEVLRLEIAFWDAGTATG